MSSKLTEGEDGLSLTTYVYNSEGHLLQVDTPEQSISYRHNALGNRVAKLIDGQVTEYYLWQDLTTLLATYDGQGNLKQRFEYTLGHTPTSFTENGQRYFVQTDHLGSPRVITDSSGSVLRTLSYDSYGNVTEDSNPAFQIPFGFAGGLYDSDTKLIRFGYRDYDPETGRWTARDPIGFAGGDTNLYGYVLGDPVNAVDLNGLQRSSSNNAWNRYQQVHSGNGMTRTQLSNQYRREQLQIWSAPRNSELNWWLGQLPDNSLLYIMGSGGGTQSVIFGYQHPWIDFLVCECFDFSSANYCGNTELDGPVFEPNPTANPNCYCTTRRFVQLGG